jgi:hypothetical protein
MLLINWQVFHPERTGYFTMSNLSDFVYNGISARLENDFVDLTNLWEMAGSPESKKPAQWARLPETKRLIAQILTEKGFQNVEKSHIIKAQRGKGGKTSAHWKLALDYAGYLSAALKSVFFDWVKERIQEEANPDLAYERGRERAVKGWQRQGKSQQWIQQRVKGIETRHDFTDTLKERGVSAPYEFAVCTNEIYKPILGGTAKDVKQARGIRNLRNELSRVELSAIDLAEAISLEKMEQEGSQGFSKCRRDCADSAARVKRVFE